MLGRPPTDNRCWICGEEQDPLDGHHCHFCGKGLHYLCTPCNLPLTEHLLHNWDRADMMVRHHWPRCQPQEQLFHYTPLPRSWNPIANGHTKRVYLSSGGGDPRFYRASTLPGFLTAEQLAPPLAINANTARNIISGRTNGHTRGKCIDGTWFCPYGDALAVLTERWDV
jgi:hypothetical protein